MRLSNVSNLRGCNPIKGRCLLLWGNGKSHSGSSLLTDVVAKVGNFVNLIFLIVALKYNAACSQEFRC